MRIQSAAVLDLHQRLHDARLRHLPRCGGDRVRLAQRRSAQAKHQRLAGRERKVRRAQIEIEKTGTWSGAGDLSNGNRDHMPSTWNPASTIRTSPVTPLPASLSRKAAASPTSDVSIALRSGAFSRTTLRIDEKPPMPAAASVLTGPAEIALTRMFSGPRSEARYRTDDSRAALATPITL